MILTKKQKEELNKQVNKIRQGMYDADFSTEEIERYVYDFEQKFYENIARIRKEEEEKFIDNYPIDPFYNIGVKNKNNIELNADIDWLQGTLKCAENCNKNLLNILIGWLNFGEKIDFEEEYVDTYFNYQLFKKKIYAFGLTIYTDRVKKGSEIGEIEKDVFYISWSGKDCKILKYFLNKNDKTTIDFLIELYTKGFSFSRIDLAIDDTKDIINLKSIKRKIEKKQYSSMFKKEPEMFVGQGLTVYFGFKTDCTIRIYDKKMEQINKLKLSCFEEKPEELPNWNRIELQLRNKYSKAFMEDIINYYKNEDTLGVIAKSWIAKKITFYSNHSENKSIAPFWRKIQEGTIKVRGTYDRLKTTINTSSQNIERQNKSLSVLYWLYQNKVHLDYEAFKFLNGEIKEINSELYYKTIQHLQIYAPHKIKQFKKDFVVKKVKRE